MSGEQLASQQRRVPANRATSRPIYVLIGAPGSGVTLTGRILSALGMDLTDVSNVQTRLFAALGRSTSVRTHDLPFPAEWYAHPTTRSARAELQEAVRAGDERTSLFGVIDTGIVRVLPMWHLIFRDLELEPHYIFCVRNPATAAESLTRRGVVADPVLGEFRWLTYVMDFLRYTSGAQTLVLPYERWFSDPMPALRSLLDFCTMAPTRLDADLRGLVDDALDPKVRHSEAGPTIRNGFVRHVYDVMSRESAHDDARADLDRLAEQFIAFQHMMQPYARMIESSGTTSDSTPDGATTQSALQTTASQPDDAEATRLREELLTANQRLADREAQLAIRSTELTQAEDTIDRLTAALSKAVESRVAGLRTN